jgi:hypothetical protein
MMAMPSGDICLLQYPTAHRAPWDTWRLQICPEPRGGNWSNGTSGGTGAALSQEAGVGARDTWRLWSCPEPGGGSWSHGTRGRA